MLQTEHAHLIYIANRLRYLAIEIHKHYSHLHPISDIHVNKQLIILKLLDFSFQYFLTTQIIHHLKIITNKRDHVISFILLLRGILEYDFIHSSVMIITLSYPSQHNLTFHWNMMRSLPVTLFK